VDLVQTLSDDGWERDVVASPLPVLVHFWADWCMPCRDMASSLEEAAKSFEGRLRTGRLNVDENPEARSRYAIRALPTTLLIKDGRECLRRVGLVERQALVELLRAQLPR